MYKTLKNYSSKKNCRHYTFETYQRDIAQQNRQLQSLAHTARHYANQVASGAIGKNSNLFSKSLDYKTKNKFCSKN